MRVILIGRVFCCAVTTLSPYPLWLTRMPTTTAPRTSTVSIRFMVPPDGKAHARLSTSRTCVNIPRLEVELTAELDPAPELEQVRPEPVGTVRRVQRRRQAARAAARVEARRVEDVEHVEVGHRP